MNNFQEVKIIPKSEKKLKTTYPDEHISSQNFDGNKNAPDLGKATGMRTIAEANSGQKRTLLITLT